MQGGAGGGGGGTRDVRHAGGGGTRDVRLADGHGYCGDCGWYVEVTGDGYCALCQAARELVRLVSAVRLTDDEREAVAAQLDATFRLVHAVVRQRAGGQIYGALPRRMD